MLSVFHSWRIQVHNQVHTWKENNKIVSGKLVVWVYLRMKDILFVDNKLCVNIFFRWSWSGIHSIASYQLTMERWCQLVVAIAAITRQYRKKINHDYRHLRHNVNKRNESDDGNTTFEDFVNFLIRLKDFDGHWKSLSDTCTHVRHNTIISRSLKFSSRISNI